MVTSRHEPAATFIRGAARQIKSAERSQLIQIYDQYRAMSNDHIRRAVIERNRIDILAGEVLGYTIKPMHLKMMRFQFEHRDSLQLAFRGGGKTTVLTVAKAVHYLIKNRDFRILLVSKTKGNAEAFLKEIKGHLENNQRLIEIFGPFYDPARVGKWDNTEIEVVGKQKATKEANITCVGVDSAVVSKHYDALLCDDMVDDSNARTHYMREGVRVFYYQTLLPTLEPPDNSVPHRGENHKHGTRYHFADTYGHLIANELKDHHQIIPALDEKGRSPWPEKYPPEWFEEKRRQMGTILFNCHADDTEFLTDAGWRLFDAVPKGAALMTLSLASGQLELQQPTARIAQPFEGRMLHLKNRGVDAVVTPDHRMVARPGALRHLDKPWSVVPAVGLRDVVASSSTRVLMPCGGSWRGNEEPHFLIPFGDPKRKSHIDHGEILVDMDTFLRFLGFFVSEGSTSDESNRGAIMISQNAGTTAEEILATIEDLGFDSNVNTYTVDGVQSHRISFSHIGLWRWLRDNCGAGSSTKRLPRFVFDLSSRQQKLLLDAAIDGDGALNPRGSDGSFWYTTTSKQLDDDLCELALRVGCSWYSRHRPAAKPEHADAWYAYGHYADSRGIDPKAQIREVPYSGRVVCFTVPNGTLVTRRKGRVLISGNCQYGNNTDAMRGEIFQYDDCQQIGEEEYPSLEDLKIFTGIDLAISEKEENDQFAICTIGMAGTFTAPTIYVLDYFTGRLRFSEQTEKVVEHYKRWKPLRMGIEANAYQAAQYQTLKEKYPTMRVRPIITDKDKITRAWKLSAHFEDKRMFFKKNVHGPVIDQLVLFPHFKFKDLFDALDLAVTTSRKRKKKRGSRQREPGLI